MSTKSREVIWGGQIMGADIRARQAREDAQKAARKADRLRMEGYGAPAQPSPTIAQCLNGGLDWLEVECNRCKTRPSLTLDAYPAAAEHADLEAGSVAEMPVRSQGPLGAAGADAQADRGPLDYALQVGASGNCCESNFVAYQG